MPTRARDEDLRRILQRIDGRGYKAYKDIAGAFAFPGWTLYVDHVQGDPFATPSKMRLRVAQSAAALPAALCANRVRRRAFEDFLARQVREALRRTGGAGGRGSGKSGLMLIDAGHQEVLERTAVVIERDWVEARIQVGLPAAGRTVLGQQAEHMLCRELPQVVAQGLLWERLDGALAERFVSTVENQEHLRRQLLERGLVAFVADGSLLPRESGASDRPLEHCRTVAFRSPGSLRVELELPNPVGGSTTIAGMGIPRGVTLIVGGGYHGKSTLLKAIERGVYCHVPGDGREYVVTTADAVKIRAEDGRRIEKVDIHPFIRNLPFGRSTRAFSSDDASGSTSQAANIVEALELGATTLLLDEDTSATNFMVRDARMQALVHKEDEPITPFVDRVRELSEALSVSTILVMGGSGDYFEAADTVIRMRDYLPEEVTSEAKEIARARPTRRAIESTEPLREARARIPLPESFDPSRGRREVKIHAPGVDQIVFGRDPIDLRGVDQLVDRSQTLAVGHAIHLAAERFMDGVATLKEVVDRLDELFDESGLDVLAPFHRPEHHPGNFARPRRYEIGAGINRLRTVRMQQQAAETRGSS